VIGAQKSGTSSLYNYLTAHPAVIRAATKEVHYFDLHFQRGPDWYRSHFPTRLALARLGRRLGLDGITGEASPYYLFHPLVPARLRALLPDARLIVVLRDPVERAVSHHNHELADGFETLTLREAIEAEPLRLNGGLGFSHQHHSYLSRGRYAEQLERWFALFAHDRFLIVDSGELFADPGGVSARALAFLGLPAHDLPRYEVAGARPHTDIDPELRRRLYEYFAPHNRRLWELLGRSFEWDGEPR
jgi:hypothetical protein